MIKRLLKYLLRLVRPKKNVYVFESHPLFTEGTYQYYLYLKKQNNNYKFFWVYDCNKEIPFKKGINYLPINSKRVLSKLRTYYWLSRAGYYLYSHRKCSYGNSKQVVFSFNHGACIKNVKHYINGTFDKFLLTNTSFQKDIYVNKMGLNPTNIFLGHNPRIIPMLSPLSQVKKQNIQLLLGNKKYNKILFAMNTWQKDMKNNNDYSFFPLEATKEEVLNINNLLKTNNALLVIKMHPMMKYNASFSMSNILLLWADDLSKYDLSVYELLNISDALISDYSSVYVDYLYTNRPIFFIASNIVKEINLSKTDPSNHDGFVFDNPFLYMPGDKIYCYKDLIISLSKFFNGVDEYNNERIKISHLWNGVYTNANVIYNNIDSILEYLWK